MKFRRNTGLLSLSLLTAFFLSACGGGGGGSSSPASTAPATPTAATTAATEIGTHSAALNGTVNPNGQATNAWLEWGIDNTLSSFTATPSQAIGAGTTAQAVGATITGLTYGTPYYYRVAAANASGTQKGTVTSFTTALPNSPPTVTTAAADSVTITSAVLHGSVIPNELATTAWFEWGTDSNLTTFSTTASQSMGAVNTSVPIFETLSLSAGTTYYFRVAATNTAGTSKGAILAFNTVAQPPTVTTAAATSVTTSSAQLNGNVNPNGLATTAQFEYGTDSTFGVLTTTPVQNFSGTTGQPIAAPVSSLLAGTTYYFRVTATNSAGTSKGTSVSFDTAQNPPPVANAGPNQTVFMGHPVTLDGSSSSDAYGTINSYQWTQISGPAVTLDTTNPVKPTFTAPTVTYPSANLEFQLKVTDNRGLSGTANVIVTVKWGFFDDFSTDTTGTYTVTKTFGSGSTFTYDVGQRAKVLTGSDNGLKFSHTLPTGNTGVFSLDFSPIAAYPSHGGFWIRLKIDDNNYYEVSNFDWSCSGCAGTPTAPDVAGVRVISGGAVVNETLFTTGYTEGSTNHIKITYSSTQIIMDAFALTITLPISSSILVSSFEVETGQQDAFYDNITLQAGP